MHGLKVLVVEDESPVAMLVEDMLEDLGCIVVDSAASVDEALKKVAAGGFDFALLDVNLAGQRVYPVAELLLAHGMPFAFASGYGAHGLPDHLTRQPVISKPFRMHDLAEAIVAALARRPSSS